jgi:hypothetical protein
LILQIILTLALTGLALWLYFHINAKNLDKKWVCDFLRGTGMNSVTQTMSFIKELDDYK